MNEDPYISPALDCSPTQSDIRKTNDRIIWPMIVGVMATTALSLAINVVVFIPLEVAFDLAFGHGPSSYGQHSLILFHLVPLSLFVGLSSVLLWIRSSWRLIYFSVAVVIAASMTQAVVEVAMLSLASFVSLSFVTGLTVAASIWTVSQFKTA